MAVELCKTMSYKMWSFLHMQFLSLTAQSQHQ